MSILTKNKFIAAIVIVLLVANTVSIAYLWMNSKESNKNKREAPFEFLVRETGMDKAQQDQYFKLVHLHRKEVAETRDNVKKAKEHFYGLLQQNNVPDSLINVSAKLVASEIEQIELINFRHFQQVRAICHKGEQQDKFDAVIREVLDMMAPRPGHPPMRGERPPGPPF